MCSDRMMCYITTCPHFPYNSQINVMQFWLFLRDLSGHVNCIMQFVFITYSQWKAPYNKDKNESAHASSTSNCCRSNFSLCKSLSKFHFKTLSVIAFWTHFRNLCRLVWEIRLRRKCSHLVYERHAHMNTGQKKVFESSEGSKQLLYPQVRLHS